MSRPVGRATLIRLTEKQWQGVDAYSDSWHYKSRAETIRAMIDQALERERMRLYQADRRRQHAVPEVPGPADIRYSAIRDYREVLAELDRERVSASQLSGAERQDARRLIDQDLLRALGASSPLPRTRSTGS